MPGPHVPITTSAGHFLSMQPATGAEPRAMTWVRADEFDSLSADRDKYRRACERVLALWNAPDDHLPADSSMDNVPMDILVAAVTIVEDALK
jgi:hypothetical protein